MIPEIISLGGAKGIGKTTTLHALEELGASTMQVSSELNRFSVDRTSKRIRELSIPQRDEIRIMFGEILAERLSHSPNRTYIDLHYTDSREDPDKILHPPARLAMLHVFVVMTADSDVILERRTKDVTRDRTLNRDRIAQEQQAEVNAAFNLAQTYKRPLRNIDASRSTSDIIFEILHV
jgi:adenylate kinase